MIEDKNAYEITVTLKKIIITEDIIDVMHQLAEYLKDIPFDIIDVKVTK